MTSYGNWNLSPCNDWSIDHPQSFFLSSTLSKKTWSTSFNFLQRVLFSIFLQFFEIGEKVTLFFPSIRQSRQSLRSLLISRSWVPLREFLLSLWNSSSNRKSPNSIPNFLHSVVHAIYWFVYLLRVNRSILLSEISQNTEIGQGDTSDF